MSSSRISPLLTSGSRSAAPIPPLEPRAVPVTLLMSDAGVVAAADGPLEAAAGQLTATGVHALWGCRAPMLRWTPSVEPPPPLG